MLRMKTSDSQSLLKGRSEPHNGDERDYGPGPADPPDDQPYPWPDDTDVDDAG